MMGRIAALVAAVGAAAAAVGAKVAWARRKDTGQGDLVDAPRTEVELVKAAEAEDLVAEEAAAEEAAEAPAEVPEAPAEVPAPAGGELQTIKGLGAVSEGRLHEIGVTTLAQIAAWSDEDVDAIAPQIKVSAERIRRDDWVGQARAASER